MKKLHIIAILLTIGFFTIPINSYSCGIKSEKSCCKKEMTKNSEKKDCCSKKDSNSKDKGCEGKCGHSNCTSSTSVNFSIISSFEISFKNNFFYFVEKKLKFYNSKTFISAGFSSILLKPKIG